MARSLKSYGQRRTIAAIRRLKDPDCAGLGLQAALDAIPHMTAPDRYLALSAAASQPVKEQDTHHGHVR